MMFKAILASGAALLATLPALAQTTPAQPWPMDYQAKPVEAQLAKVRRGVEQGPFKSDWSSLQQFRTPDWFRDAKFGIFIHWGVYSVPAFANEWYSRNMYVPGNAAYEHHVKTYGPQAKFGYKDFIPMFKAERFDPAAWIRLFGEAGAKYVVPVAEHCDGFAMYASDFTRWDASEMGPKRDVTGEIAQAARKAGMHFGLSSHRGEHSWWYHKGRSFPSDIGDPRYAGLYGPAMPTGLPADKPDDWPDGEQLQNWHPPTQQFLNDWMARTSELIDKYRPELIYFDWWTAAPSYEPLMRDAAAYYYNRSASWGAPGIIAYKGAQFAEGSALFDIERGKTDQLRLTPWQSDTSVSIKSWGYTKNDEYRTAASLVTDLVDIVSKNGNLLLNVGPKADGTIPDEIAGVLRGMGAWLKVNGEAIYGTRPFAYYGEGPTKSGHVRQVGQFTERNVNRFTPADLRFTTKGETLYMLGLARPADGAVLAKTLYAGTPYLQKRIARIELLGHGAVKWQQTSRGLSVTLPADTSGGMPYALKLSFAK